MMRARAHPRESSDKALSAKPIFFVGDMAHGKQQAVDTNPTIMAFERETVLFHMCRGIRPLSLQEPFVFSTEPLAEHAARRQERFVNAKPFPSIAMGDVLPEAQAELVLDQFPGPDSETWLDWRKRDVVHQPKKQGIGHASNLEKVSPHVQNMLMAFNSYPFLRFLEVLTGVNKLMPDALATPEGVTRKSLALYYYTAQPSDSDAYDENTDWQE